MGVGAGTFAYSLPPPMSRLPLLFAIAALALAACDGSGGYVGTWRAAGPDSLGMRYQFFADGTARIVERAPGAEPVVYGATYEIVGDSLLWLRDDTQDGRFRVALDGDTLRLENPASGQRTVWVRL